MSKYYDRLPRDDSEVKEWIDNLYTKEIAVTLNAIYEVRRKMGDSILDAYEYAMRRDYEACGLGEK